MKSLIAVALSGGIDSLVAAKLLIQQGHPVVGIHFATGYESPNNPSPQQLAELLSSRLGIDVYLMDAVQSFRETVVDYFVRTYLSGLTPNPCMVCNPLIKFGTVLDYARSLGASLLATGHYARISSDSDGTMHLLKGIDPMKDQSYFLSRMTQTQLARACFPLGGMAKSRVIQLAQELKLEPVHHGESQDICFIRGRTYGEFLMSQEGFVSSSGPIETVAGKIIGGHPGLHLFTIGQRRGINCPAAQPYYVVRLNRKTNTLVVGFKSDLLASSCRVRDINWIAGPPEFPARVYTRVRYRSQAVESTLYPLYPDGGVAVVFDAPQPSVTPGQGAVFYRKDDEVIGGGWISQISEQGFKTPADIHAQ
jgi:tRNA-uridine 2-sulfurtransferase